MLKAIKKYFTVPPKGIPVKNTRFYTVNSIATHLALLSHLYWLVEFAAVGVMEMCYFNFISVGVFIVAIFLNRRGYHLASALMAASEVCLHQVLAAYYVGWEAGYQYYIFNVCIFPFMQGRGKIILKLIWTVLCLVAFLYIEVELGAEKPQYLFPAEDLYEIKISNIAYALILTGLWGAIFNHYTFKAEDELEKEKSKSDELLRNILPVEVAEELKQHGSATPQLHEQVSILFTDFKGFTSSTRNMDPTELVMDLEKCFTAFDAIIKKHKLEKIKTIGDAYMCAGGIPIPSETNPIDTVSAALEIRNWMKQHNAEREKNGKVLWQVRIGIHTGNIVAGVIGTQKFAYDIWGDAVNVASRMESNSDPGKINISSATYELVKDHFECEYRGEIEAKNRGRIGMYFVLDAKKETAT